MRLIDADALKNTIKNMPNDYYGDLCIGDALKEIDDAPTIDAVPVVRCRECKHYQTDVLFNHNYCCGRRRKPDDYCSYGERRETKWS